MRLVAFEEIEQGFEHRVVPPWTAGKQKAPTGPSNGTIRVLPGERGYLSMIRPAPTEARNDDRIPCGSKWLLPLLRFSIRGKLAIVQEWGKT